MQYKLKLVTHKNFIALNINVIKFYINVKTLI